MKPVKCLLVYKIHRVSYPWSTNKMPLYNLSSFITPSKGAIIGSMYAGLNSLCCQKWKPKVKGCWIHCAVTPAVSACHFCLWWLVYWKAELECNLRCVVKIQFSVWWDPFYPLLNASMHNSLAYYQKERLICNWMYISLERLVCRLNVHHFLQFWIQFAVWGVVWTPMTIWSVELGFLLGPSGICFGPRVISHIWPGHQSFLWA